MANKDNAHIYVYIHEKTGDCLYVGISTTPMWERHRNHMKPAKYHEQPINTYIQDNDDWKIMEIGTVSLNVKNDAKAVIHILERYFVEKYKPSFNKMLVKKEEEEIC